jgi:hypothetical protein
MPHHHLLRVHGLPRFQHDRAKTDRESTTMLSPWIHFGSCIASTKF